MSKPFGGKVLRNPAHFRPEGITRGTEPAHQESPRSAGYVPGTIGGGDLRLTPNNFQLGDRPHLP